MQNKYDIAAYVWPAYSGDDTRSRLFWPDGIGEWQTVKNGPKSGEDAYKLRKPVWGYVNEADPMVMEMEIEAAARHGVNVFIYDWYWYDNRPFLENCLNDGYLKASNNDKVKFYLMWANHDANYTWDTRNAGCVNDVIWGGQVTFEQFQTVAVRVIERYFTHPSYYTIDGKPVFSIYDIKNLIDGLGGVPQTQKAFAWFREECEHRGLKGLHLQLVRQNPHIPNLSGIDGKSIFVDDLTKLLGFDSTTHYQFAHMCPINRDHGEIVRDVQSVYRTSGKGDIPYFPHISVGWDNNPRFIKSNDNITLNNPPEAFKQALESAKNYADEHPDQPPLITINSWNEWTESSYLLPDLLYGYGYLEAIRDVFEKEDIHLLKQAL